MGHMIGLGLALGHLLPDTAWATYTFILLSYHLVLAFRVLIAEKKAGLSLPIGSAILTHMACVGLLIGLAVGRHQIPFFGIIRYFIPGLGAFEANWLFNGEKKIVISPIAPDVSTLVAATSGTSVPVPEIVATPSLYATSTGEDYEEFLKLLQQGKRPSRKPGVSVKDEYELWLGARAKARAAVSANTPSI